jgi:hypothetical protein
MREWRYSSTILNLYIRWRWVVSFTHRPLYLRGRSRSWRYREEKDIWRVASSEVWRRVVSWVARDVSEELIASIFRVEVIGSVDSACHPLARWFAEPISSTLKMEAISSPETSDATQRTTQRHTPEDDTLHNHRCENLKSYREITFRCRESNPGCPVRSPSVYQLSPLGSPRMVQLQTRFKIYRNSLSGFEH